MSAMADRPDDAPTGPRPVRLSDLPLASAAREARVALANGWWEARYELDIDHRKAAGS